MPPESPAPIPTSPRSSAGGGGQEPLSLMRQLRSVALWLLLALLLRWIVVEPRWIPSGSMLPTEMTKLSASSASQLT